MLEAPLITAPAPGGTLSMPVLRIEWTHGIAVYPYLDAEGRLTWIREAAESNAYMQDDGAGRVLFVSGTPPAVPEFVAEFRPILNRVFILSNTP
jgi:hypothetical protein